MVSEICAFQRITSIVVLKKWHQIESEWAGKSEKL
jgi:hypothetical protein